MSTRAINSRESIQPHWNPANCVALAWIVPPVEAGSRTLSRDIEYGAGSGYGVCGGGVRRAATHPARAVSPSDNVPSLRLEVARRYLDTHQERTLISKSR